MKPKRVPIAMAAVLAGMLCLSGAACASTPIAGSDAELQIEEIGRAHV